jgi:hypothetical protein
VTHLDGIQNRLKQNWLAQVQAQQFQQANPLLTQQQKQSSTVSLNSDLGEDRYSYFYLLYSFVMERNVLVGFEIKLRSTCHWTHYPA